MTYVCGPERIMPLLCETERTGLAGIIGLARHLEADDYRFRDSWDNPKRAQSEGLRLSVRRLLEADTIPLLRGTSVHYALGYHFLGDLRHELVLENIYPSLPEGDYFPFGDFSPALTWGGGARLGTMDTLEPVVRGSSPRTAWRTDDLRLPSWNQPLPTNALELVPCPHCGWHTALNAMLPCPYIKGAWHCVHCGRLAWWQAFDPRTGDLEPRLRFAAVINAEFITPLNRERCYRQLTRDGAELQWEHFPLLFVDPDAVHPWHGYLFSQEPGEDREWFVYCDSCGEPFPAMDVDEQGRVTDTDPAFPAFPADAPEFREVEYFTDRGDTIDVVLCDDHAADLYVCDNCGIYVAEDSVNRVTFRSHDQYWCENCCRDNDGDTVFRCTNCHDWFSTSFAHTAYSGDLYCESCFVDLDHYEQTGEPDVHPHIHPYSYKPAPIFGFGSIHDPARMTGVFYGIELEASTGNDESQWNFAEDWTHALCDNERHFYMKQDASLDLGIEFVSHPISLEAWQTPDSTPRLCLEEIARLANEYGYDRDDDGLHIHVSRNAFVHHDPKGDGKMELRHKAAFDAFFNRVLPCRDDALVALIGRSEMSWAQALPVSGSLGAVIRKLSKREPKERYRAVNWNNYATAEVRVFRSSPDVETILARIEFVDAVVNFSNPQRSGATQSQIVHKFTSVMLWGAFYNWVLSYHSTQYPNLCNLLHRY